MALTVFGKRLGPKQRGPQPATTHDDSTTSESVTPRMTQLGTNYAASNAIQPGAKAGQFNGPKLGNPIEQIGKGLHWLHTYDPWKKK